VWLHGGGYVTGAGSDYDASRMAALGGVTVVTDARFACPGLRISELAADGDRSYLYEFADRTAPASVPFPTDIPLGAAHTSELPYLFDLGPVVVPLSTQQRAIGDEMIRYWSRFAQTHRPGSRGDQPRWPALRDRDPSLAVFGSDGTSIDPVAGFSRIHRCDFWARTESLPLPPAAPTPGDDPVT
jgi:para-nitrobenzyl esterase